jgi:hypothetical protein
MDTNTKQKTELNLKIYQCPDKSWRILSKDYIDEWGDYKLRALSPTDVACEIRRLITNACPKNKNNEREAV